MIIAKRDQEIGAVVMARRRHVVSNSAVSILLITIALAVLPHAVAHATVWECMHGANLDTVPWATDPSKGQQSNPIRQKVIFVSFNSSENAGPEYASDRQAMLDACAGMFDRESRGMHRISYEIVEVPGQPGAMWRLSPESPSDFATSGDFGSESSVLLFDRFLSSWTASSAYQGELLGRVMELIKRAYDIEDPTGNWVSPLAGADAVLIAIAPDAGGNVQNPLYRNITTLGVPRLSLRTNTNDPRIAPVVNAAPSIGRDNAMLGTVVLLGPAHPRRNVAVASHLWGHVLGMDDLKNPRSSVGVPGSAGGYSVMRWWLDIAESTYLPYEQFDHPSRVRTGWIAPVRVDGNVRGAVIAPCKSGGAVYLIPVAQSRWSQPDLIGVPYWTSLLDEYFIVAYEDGQHPEYSAADAGLYIWHCLDYSRKCDTDEWPCWYGKVLMSFGNRDLEVATGMFGDPGTWQVADTINGSDTLDFWDGRDFVEFWAHMGSASDLFDHGGSKEFSYRVAAPNSINPSSYGYAATAFGLRYLIGGGNFSPPGPIPESVPTTISVRIKGLQAGGLVVDLVVAPFADVTTPNGGDVLQVDSPHRIEWSQEDIVGQPNGIINTIDIHYLPGDGRPEREVALGVDATAPGYDWTPTLDDLSAAGRVRLTFHNINSTTVATDESDAPFTVVADVAKYVDVSDLCGLSYVGTPYSSNCLDFDGDGREDLLISMYDGASHLFAGKVPIGDLPVFEFSWAWPDQLDGHRGIAIADYDNDGDEDIFLAHATAPKLIRNDGGVAFTDVTASLGLASLADQSTAACWGDFDRDGWVDLYVVRSATPNPPSCDDIGGLQHRLFRNGVGKGGGFVDVSVETGINWQANLASLSASWTDIDRDGDLDLAVALADRPLYPQGGSTPLDWPHSLLLINDDAGHFIDEAHTRLPLAFDGCPAIEWADLDNDGYQDLVAGNAFGAPRVLWNDGTGSFAGTPYEELPAIEGHGGLKIFDQDLDGWLDILLVSQDSQQPTRLFTNKGAVTGARFVETTADAGLTGLGAALGAVAADFNNDGDADLYLGKPDTPGSQYFYKAGTRGGAGQLERNYVRLHVTSPDSANNGQGLGAQVTVTAGLQVQTRILDGGSGRGGQGDREPVFGLGAYTGPVTASVRWPGGWTTEDVPLVISNGVVGPTVNMIVDDTSPTVANAQALCLVDPETGAFSWEFSWDTDVSSNAARDEVNILQSGIASPCWPNDPTIVVGPDAGHVYIAKPGGGYRHVITHGVDECIIGCSFRFSTTSEVGTRWSSSPLQLKKIKFCPYHN